MARGECSCGAVAYAIDGELSGVFVCHCSICRRSSGANGVAVVLADKARFRWLRGEDRIASWSKPGTDWHTWFCRVCGARLPGENDPTRMYVPAGGLVDGGEALRVLHHVWVGSKAPWDEIGDHGRQHVEQYRTE